MKMMLAAFGAVCFSMALACAVVLLFNFFPQGYDKGLLICIRTAGESDEAVENARMLLCKNHGTLIPLPAEGWYYIENVNARREE